MSVALDAHCLSTLAQICALYLLLRQNFAQLLPLPLRSPVSVTLVNVLNREPNFHANVPASTILVFYRVSNDKAFESLLASEKIEITVSKLLPWVAFEKDADNQRLVADPRCKELFVYRCLSESQPLENVVDGSYSKLRYSLGLTEGPNEIPSGQAFPLEYNADLLNAVSFDKGCYVGQELTARVHHTGVVRKRIMPLELSEAVNGSCGFSEPVIDSETKKPVGKIRGVTENRALALVRISETVSSKGLTWGQLKVRATIPSWWPSLRESSASRR